MSCSSEWKDSAVVQMTLRTVCTVVLAVDISVHTRQREKYALVVTGCNMFFRCDENRNALLPFTLMQGILPYGLLVATFTTLST